MQEIYELRRIAKATERIAELLEILMLDDELITRTQYAKVANKERTQR